MKAVKKEVKKEKLTYEQRLENLQAQLKQTEMQHFKIQGAIEIIKGLIAEK